MDVTNEILRNHQIYGASDNTAPHRHASGRSLNYAAGPSITRPAIQNVTIAPYNIRMESSVGLFGAENYFLRVNLNILNIAPGTCYEEEFWLCGAVDRGDELPDVYYGPGLITDGDFTYTDTYIQAAIEGDTLPFQEGQNAFVSVDLANLKTGNIYNDDWLDVRLYTADREEHPLDKMYIRDNSYFYIGIHARNTRRLNFDVACLIGQEYLPYNSIKEKQLIMKSTAFGSYGAYDAYEPKRIRVRQDGITATPMSTY